MPSKTAANTGAIAEEGEELNPGLSPAEESRRMTEDIVMGRGEVLDTLDDSPQAAQEQIVRRILAAPDEDAVLADDSTVATRDLVEVPLRVSAFHLRKSQLVDNDTGEIKEGAYMIVDAVDLRDDSQVTLNTGAPKIMAQLIRLQQLERLPATVMGREGGPGQPRRNCP